VIEERARGDAGAAEAVRAEVTRLVGGDLAGLPRDRRRRCG